MTQPNTTSLNAQSGKQNGKQSRRIAGKGSTEYWAGKTFRPVIVGPGGSRRESKLYVVRLQHGGRREAVALQTDSRNEAGRRAARFYLTLKAVGWDAAHAELNPERHAAKLEQTVRETTPTVGEWVSAVEIAANLNPKTFRGYSVAFRRIVSEIAGIAGDRSRYDAYRGGRDAWKAKVDAVPLDSITPAKVETWRGGFVRDRGTNPVLLQRARRNANSLIRQARALFSRTILKRIPLTPTPPLPFDGVEFYAEGNTRYVGMIDAKALMIAAQQDLREADPQAWLSLILLMCGGLRRGELDMLGWKQIEDGNVHIRTTEVFSPKTATSERTIPLAPSIAAEVETFRTKATGAFVIESPNPPPSATAQDRRYRCKPVFDRLVTWLRTHGITAAKPLHELRKEFGSLIARQADIFTASRMLGHSNLDVTQRYYAEQRKRVVVDPLNERAGV